MPSVIEKFFELYASAFMSLNPAYISKVYDFPMTFYTEGEEIYHSTTRYLMKLIDGGLKIKAVFVVDETSKIAALRQ